eukprot:GHRR01021752.1.p3 GENE.GHRR01021752.1~~GHRR01021752.1.p3  ORF type:complete len:120 (-),score=36.78 GHRR01021752.1:197-556(-)
MTRQYAREFGWVNTMIGRRRQLKDINSSEKWLRGRAERAAINTPIQGSAADVASAAMLSIGRDKWLTDNDWKLLLQVRMRLLSALSVKSQNATAYVLCVSWWACWVNMLLIGSGSMELP